MNIKTITAPTIQAALAEARRTLGDDVVLLESVAAEGDRPASVRVMVDRRTAVLTADANTESIGIGYGYGYSARAAAASGAVAEQLRTPSAIVAGAPVERDSILTARGPRDTLFRQQPAPDSTDSDLIVQFLRMQERLGELEKAIRESNASAAPWNSVETLAMLHDRGLRPQTLQRIFDRISSARAGSGSVACEPLVRNELRRMLEMPVFRPSAAAFMMIGPAGAGKTALLLKLTRNEEYLGRRRACVIAIELEQPNATAYQSPADLYRAHGIPVQSVTCREQMAAALDRAASFEPILVDTPSLPLDRKAAHGMAARLETITKDLVPLHVQLVLDATRDLDEGSIALLKKLAVRPNSVALTHLDETSRWGRAAEWLMDLGLPYGYGTDGAGVPDGISVLNASRIADRLTTP